MDSPIFIVGANRSGTTLLRLILNAHPRIAIPDELIYFNSYLAGVPIERWQNPDLSPKAYEAFVDGFLSNNCEPLEELDRDELKDEILAGPHDFKHPYKLALETWSLHYGKKRWGEKTPGNLFYADIILEMFPHAQFIYMVRDPRAGVASMQRVSFFPDDICFNALSRRKHDIVGRSLLKQHVPASQRMTIRYEDLVGHPEASTRSICKFLDEPFTPEMLQFHEGADQYMKDEAEANYNAMATQPITDDRIDAWKESLSADQIAIVESICADVMKAFKYTPREQRPSLRAKGKVLTKWLYWSYECWRNREIRHYTVKSPMFARTRSRLRTLRDRTLHTLHSMISSSPG